jgi:hypothetical protein
MSSYQRSVRIRICTTCGHPTLANICRLCEVPTFEIGSEEYQQYFKEKMKMDAKAAAAMQKRYEFWHVKQNQAIESSNDEAFQTASANIEKIEAEAKEAGVTLAAPGTQTTGETAAAPATKSKSKKGADAVAAKAQAVAAEKAAGTAPGATKVKKEKKAPTLKPCLDGCGTMVAGNFKMGHDAKLKSTILKIERGEEEQSAIPEISQGLVKFKKAELEKVLDKEGKLKETIQHFTCTAAPVKLTGRVEGEFKLTKRED